MTKQNIRNYRMSMVFGRGISLRRHHLASRFAYGRNNYTQKIGMVERAEQFTEDYEFIQMRVRMHGSTSRIEVTSNAETPYSEIGKVQGSRVLCNHGSAPRYRVGSMRMRCYKHLSNKLMIAVVDHKYEITKS